MPCFAVLIFLSIVNSLDRHPQLFTLPARIGASRVRCSFPQSQRQIATLSSFLIGSQRPEINNLPYFSPMWDSALVLGLPLTGVDSGLNVAAASAFMTRCFVEVRRHRPLTGLVTLLSSPQSREKSSSINGRQSRKSFLHRRFPTCCWRVTRFINA